MKTDTQSNETLNTAIGAHIRSLRKKAGLRQTPIAHAIGLDQSAFSRIESGKQSLSAAQWVLFCQHLELKPDRFVRAITAQVKKTKQD